MESNKRNFLLFLLLALLCVCTVRMFDVGCPSSPDTNLTCYNDYNRNITCVWNSAHEHTDAGCTLHAKNMDKELEYSSSCDLESADARSVQKNCSLYFNKNGRFQFFDELSITLSCNHVKNILTIPYKPYCHIKLNPPGKPGINFTTVSWHSQIQPHERLASYVSQLQWKKWDQSWSDPSVETKLNECDFCKAELNPEKLIQGETYEARVRVKTTESKGATWSDWGPTASWVSRVGRPKPPPSGVFGGVLGISITGAVFALCLAVKLLRNEKVNWIYKKITGSPIPNPDKSFLNGANFQNWMSPHFASELSHSSLIQGEIVFVEVTSTVDAVTPCKKEAAMQEKMISENSYKSTNSGFSNPSYSHLCASPPVSSLATDNLQPHPADTPNASVGSQGDGKTAEQAREDESKKKLEIQQLLSKDNNNNNSETVQVVSDYEKVERPPAERFRLQSLDSGMCSGEEVSLEADSFSATDVHDEESGDKEQEREERTEKVDFKKLFGGSGNVFGKGSIQICSDYEKVPGLNPGSPELSSVDSGVCSGSEEQASHEEILEDFDKSSESTRFQFPPPLSATLPCSSLSFPQLPLKFSEVDLSPALQPPSHLLERIALMTMSRSMEPVDDGYMPVKQEQS